MSKRVISLLAGVGATVALVTGVGLAGNGTGGASGSGVRIHEAAADYPSYADLSAIDRASTSVVRGVVENVGTPYRVIPEGLPVDQLPPHKAAQVGIVKTDVTVRVAATLSGADLTGKVIIVGQLGGQIGDDRVVVEEEPSAEKGATYVLFLRGFSDGKFGVVGGPQGRYAVRDGKLASLGEHAREKGVGKQLHGVQLADLERNYRALANTPVPERGREERQEPLKPTNIPPKP